MVIIMVTKSLFMERFNERKEEEKMNFIKTLEKEIDNFLLNEANPDKYNNAMLNLYLEIENHNLPSLELNSIDDFEKEIKNLCNEYTCNGIKIDYIVVNKGDVINNEEEACIVNEEKEYIRVYTENIRRIIIHF